MIPFIKNTRDLTKALFSKIYLNKNSILSPEQYKKLSPGAIYSEQQTAYINSRETLRYLRDKGLRQTGVRSQTLL